MNHPVMYDNSREILGGAKAATHEYWPPATGYIEHISAMGMATARVRRLTPMKLKTITGGPPDVTPTIKTPLNAVHLEAESAQWALYLDGSDLRGDDAETEPDHTQEAK